MQASDLVTLQFCYPLIVILKVHKSLYFVTSLLLARNFLLTFTVQFSRCRSRQNGFRIIRFRLVAKPYSLHRSSSSSQTRLRWALLGFGWRFSDPRSDWNAQSFDKTLQSKLGGDNRNRTDDPLLARQVLSQLSYTPIIKRWWAQVDSNHRPHDYQSCALASWAMGPCVHPLN